MITEALLLRASDYREADRILTLFTRAAGKVSAIARGARSSRRRFAGALEPYAVIRVELSAQRGELMLLKQAELLQPFATILSDLVRMDVAGAALTLVRESHAPHLPDEPLFLSTVQLLTVLEHDGDPQRSLLLGFALRALACTGLAPRLDACGRSREAVPEGRPAYFDPTLGAVVARRFGGGPFLLPGGLRMRLLRAQGEDWLDAARAPWPAEELALARAAVAAFIRAHLPNAEGLAARLFPPQV